jgi:hypothetical protein
LVARVTAHLLDVGVAVDHIDEHVADGRAGIVDGYPGPTIGRVAGEHLLGGGLVVGHVRQAHRAEALACRPLDPAKCRPVAEPGRTDADGHPPRLAGNERTALPGPPRRFRRRAERAR